MQPEPEPAAQPRCARCRGELFEMDNSLPCRLMGVFALLVAAALAVFGRRGASLRTTGVTAALLLTGWLAARRVMWRCATCGASYRRQPPPRGMGKDTGAPREAPEDTGSGR